MFIKAAAAVAAITGMSAEAFARNFSPDAEPIRYHDPDIVALDDRFKYKLGNTPIQRIYKGTLWAEGPAWNGVGRYLLWSDIPTNEQLRWLEEDGHVARRFRSPSGNSNGNTFDFHGRQIACEHGNRRVVRYEYDGSITVLADSYNGKDFNAPNDAVVHPDDGAIWFTDPGYGSLMNYEGHRFDTGSVQPFQKEAVYRIDAQTGKLEQVTDEIYKPNGLCFSPDYKKLYVADTGSSHYADAPKGYIKVWDIVDGKRLQNGKEFTSMEYEGKFGLADGIRADVDGNIWASAGWVGDGYDGVHVFAPNGDRIGMIKLPEICSNVCFGGSKRNRLFMTASQSLYAVYVETQGAHIT
ncbi:SMP-30/gluconolactonase/LRE family protein [candidate division KSB3 bacterium]|uniref:SMP-30/gluconolactonase/LRE family protein n=1 Tax=candidate division KSB3 bacterium TaxID=2044937 RepID=A0A9D5Q7J7_9BACT|nr:SMP-30/gluconolactonase/LRE family protein [candidate division KSB3 bacterium]MBD3326954.1 SMP-30/gluconolactonase/LRE family protein [candidate division KSB3 bacterium]